MVVRVIKILHQITGSDLSEARGDVMPMYVCTCYPGHASAHLRSSLAAIHDQSDSDDNATWLVA